MYSRLLGIIVEIAKKKENKTKCSVKDVEKALQNCFYNRQEYINAGGYNAFCQAMMKLEEEGWLQPIKASPMNHLVPPLYEYYWIAGTKEKESYFWEDSIILMLKDELDIHHYLSLPHLQTKENLEKVMAVYRFMKTKDEHNWLKREERSLMLFGDEKFLGSNNGKSFLSRLNLNPHDLKIEPKKEKFRYAMRADFAMKSNVNVLIIEGEATFETFEYLLNVNPSKWFFGTCPDLLIYGQGSGILSRFPFIKSFISDKIATIRYSGDIDPSGLNIFYTLVTRFPQYEIQLAEELYDFMLLQEKTYPIRTQQVISESTQLHFQSYFPCLYKRIETLFVNKQRIPQEIVNFDTIALGG
ncbi:hypothetical protein BACERE00185_05027 [Bacillus mobilis]|uniref:Wadjet protein JetD C-terminal domain-containing protein n=1 Tax=Bacillus mobilis TaxID=2026190 RepID=A0A1Y6AN12_9BACI|nr:Wadjet anti-phage system protein JetD domain-containing protein [Bacillus mobilis]SME45613.1 hypothetical protein BACERE00185_05027 [Bacillus mobilis]